jgi:outer membrane protein
MKKSIATIILSVLVSSLACWVVILWKAPKKHGYVENLKLYDEFKGKKELETKLINIKSSNKLRLDSLRLLVVDDQSELYYRQQLLTVEQEEKELNMNYNTQIWNQLNSYIQDYGDENGYDFIYGATGSGSIMYARQHLDITKEIIHYANKSYEGN